MLKMELSPVSGSSTHLRATLRNDSSKVVRFLYWNTIFDAQCPIGLQIDGDSLPSVPYRGPRAKYAFDPEHSLISLPAGGAIERELDVSLNYRLPAAAAYTLSFNGQLRGVIGDASVDTTCKLTALGIESTESEFRLAPVSTDHLFPAAFASAENDVPACDTPLCWNSYYEPPLTCVLGRARYGHARIEGGSESQKAVVRRAVDRMFNRMAHRGPYRLDIRDSAEYRRWFGPYTEARGAQVRQAVAGIVGQSICKSFVIYILAGCIEPDRIAVFRKPDSEDRYGALGLCRPYFREGESGYNSQAGTLAHELSHGYGNTDDHEYGETCCLRLAAKRPDLAVANADSIQYFLEQVLLSKPFIESASAVDVDESQTT